MTNSRKIKRAKEKQAKKEIKQKMNMFSRLGDECLACTKSFDKTNKEHVTTWTVVVRESEKKVNLYCPDCWDMANTAIKTLTEEIENARK